MKEVLSSWFSGFRWWESFTTAGGASLALYGYLAMELKAPQNPSLIASGIAFAVLWLVFWRNPKAQAWAEERLDNSAVQAVVAESATDIEARLKAEYEKQWARQVGLIKAEAEKQARANIDGALKTLWPHAALPEGAPAPEGNQ